MKHRVIQVCDVTKIKEKNAWQKNSIFENPRWPPAAILKIGGSVLLGTTKLNTLV